eukprot:5858331-Amphidinium_carterae.1
MYLPAACAIGSDFWRVSVIGSIASNMGKVNLSIFNAGYRTSKLIFPAQPKVTLTFTAFRSLQSIFQVGCNYK